jgi:drug/metabolite transporter (DMT)-like permease
MEIELDSELSGWLTGVSASFFFGLLSYIVHAQVEIPAEIFARDRALFATLILLPLIYKDIPCLFRKSSFPIWIRAVAGTGALLCLFYNLQMTSVGNAVIFSNLTPIFILPLGAIFFSERITKFEFFGISLIIAGALSLSISHTANLSLTSVTVGLVGALCASLAFLAIRQSRAKFGPLLVVWSVSCVSAITLSFLPSCTNYHYNLVQFKSSLVVGALGAIGQVLMTLSFFRLKSATAGAINLCTVLWGTLIEFVFTGMFPANETVVSYIVIAIGILGIARAVKRPSIQNLSQTRPFQQKLKKAG